MFLIAGEALIDMVPTAQGTFLPVAGGAPYNFARALALQAIAASYANPLSDDAFGVLLRNGLAAAGVRHLGRRTSRPTSLALVATDSQGHPHYSFYREGVADRDIDAETLIALDSAEVTGFHTGGLALVPPDDRCVLAASHHFRRRGVLCTADINMRPQVAVSLGIAAAHYRDAALEVISSADIVKVSDEDLHHLGFEDAPAIHARELLARGPKIVVVTLGADGALAFADDEQVFQPAQKVDVVDTVGAGDCFFAGFIASLQRQGRLAELNDRVPPALALEEALRYAAVCAAIDISRQGCQPPTREEAERWVER
jgi:fructokinase